MIVWWWCCELVRCLKGVSQSKEPPYAWKIHLLFSQLWSSSRQFSHLFIPCMKLEGQHSVCLLFLGSIKTLIFTSWHCRNFVLDSSWTGKTLEDSLFVVASHSVFFLLYICIWKTIGFVTEQAAVQINNTRTVNKINACGIFSLALCSQVC